MDHINITAGQAKTISAIILELFLTDFSAVITLLSSVRCVMKFRFPAYVADKVDFHERVDC
jgi:hypothetical protein